MERIDAVRATGLADLIVIEEYKGQKIDDILKYGVEIFAIGSDWEGYFDYLNEFCKVVYLPRTEGISSTQIRKHRPVADIGIIGTGSIASRFASESAFVNSARITGAYNPLKSECDDFCKSSTFRQARILSKSCFKSATLSTSPRLTTLILIMPKRRCAQGNTSSAKPRLSQAERKPKTIRHSAGEGVSADDRLENCLLPGVQTPVLPAEVGHHWRDSRNQRHIDHPARARGLHRRKTLWRKHGGERMLHDAAYS